MICNYCGQRVKPHWLKCGQGEWDGCGAPILKSMRKFATWSPKINLTLHPGISARKFNEEIKRAIRAKMIVQAKRRVR